MTTLPDSHRLDDRRGYATADTGLVDRLASGDLEAAGELYDRYAPLVFGLARRILRINEDAEEVVQDVFSQAWRTAGGFEANRGTVAGWLLVMARSRSIDRLRRRHGQPLGVQGWDPDSTASLSSGPSDQLLSNEQALHVREALFALPEAQRTALELAYYEGLTQAEIAERLAEPLGTVKTRIRSALLTLRKRLSS